MTNANSAPVHHFTVDVEEHFQVAALAPYVPRAQWDQFESRVERNTALLLDLLHAHEARGTFFVLGWVAERHPHLVQRIWNAGHELASHGWGHRKVTDLTPHAFRASVRKSKRLIEDLIGGPVVGYRAPSFSIVRGREWALDILAEEGYRYDSSLFPIRRKGYGYRNGPRDPHLRHVRGGMIREFPPATLQIGALRLPAAGGAYLRLLPFRLVFEALQQANRRGVSTTLYIHPWEVDPEQPRFPVPVHTRIRHYGGLQRTATRLDRLLSTFQFRPIAESLDQTDALAVPR